VSVVARIPPRAWLLVVPAALVAQAAILLAMGRAPICPCGIVKLWHGVVYSSENSQHIFDWYSITHIMHGFALYLVSWFLLPHAPIFARLALAVLFEGAWEILENSPYIIDRYRSATIALDYYGDSVVNSVADTVSMMFGFALASVLPAWSIIALTAIFEALLLYLIRDSLLLNIIMLMYPVDAIKAWQQVVPMP
jgi:hypothetical protein